MSKLLACLCVLVLCGSANIAVGQRAVAEVQRLPGLEKVFAVCSKLGQKAMVVGTSLLLLCSQPGCGPDDADETKTAASELVAAAEDTRP